MAMVTVHQWPDPVAGLREMRRVARGPVLVLTFDPAELGRLWLTDYAPELQQVDAGRCPSIETLTAALGQSTEVRPAPIPIDSVDGFTEAFYARPELYWTRPSAGPNPPGASCRRAWRNAPSKPWPPTSPQEPGTNAMVPTAPSPSSRVPYGSSSATDLTAVGTKNRWKVRSSVALARHRHQA
jgi:hypothetical protein